jgi:tetratricopeptide (TPR) repeat protein
MEAPQALSLAETITDNMRASRACLLAMKGLVIYGTPTMGSPQAAQWAIQADRYAEPETVERAWADTMLVWVKNSVYDFSANTVALKNRIYDLYPRLGDPDTYWWADGMLVFSGGTPQHDAERLHMAEELAERPRHGVNFLILAMVLFFVVHTFLEFGQRRRAEDVMAEMRTLAERSGQPNLLIVSMLNDAIMAIWDGRLEEALAIRRRILARAQELGIIEFAVMWTTWILPARVYLGDAGRALEAQLQGARSIPENVGGDQVILYCLAHLGRYAEVAKMLERRVVSRPGIGSDVDETTPSFDSAALQAAVLAGHRQAAELLLRRFAGSKIVTSGLWCTTCTGRHLGAAAALLGRHDEARTHYQEALKVATELKFRPEVALIRLQLAELLLEHYPKERAQALEHLDFAIAEFRDMKMQPSLERALRHKDILKA